MMVKSGVYIYIASVSDSRCGEATSCWMAVACLGFDAFSYAGSVLSTIYIVTLSNIVMRYFPTII